jgi:hypothetical protein
VKQLLQAGLSNIWFHGQHCATNLKNKNKKKKQNKMFAGLPFQRPFRAGPTPSPMAGWAGRGRLSTGVCPQLSTVACE